MAAHNNISLETARQGIVVLKNDGVLPIAPDTNVRIAVIGGHAHLGVPLGGLREAGHRVEVIKAGVPSYDTRLEVLYLERLVDLYHPDIVVVGFLPNDLFTNIPINESNVDGLPENSLQSGRDRLQDLGVIAASEKKSELHSLILAKRLMMMNDELYTKLYLLTPRRAFFTSPPTDLLNQQVNVTRSLFLRAKQFCEEKGCELMVISIPQQFQVIAAAKRVNTESIDPGYIDSAFGQTEKDWGVLLPVLTEAYDATGQDLYYRYDGHLNSEGNAVVGAFVIDYLSNWLKQRAFADSVNPAVEQLPTAPRT